MSSEVHQPHDKLVKKLLSNPATARDILSLYLPGDVLKIADLNHLELQKDSFIDDEHRAYAVDILYKTQFQKEDGYIWLLLEHQRTSNPWMPVRLFKYIAIIWDHLRKTAKSTSIPLVYPLVIYNGDQPYAHSLILSDLIESEAARKIFGNLFVQPFCLVDLATIGDESLRKSAQDRVKGIALLMALKHVFDRDLQAFLEQTLIKVLKRLDQAGDTDEVVDVLYYILNESEFLDEGWFWHTFHREFSQEVEGKMTTIAQKLEARGMEKGMQKGMEKGMEKGIEKGMEKGMEKGKLEIARRLLTEKAGLGENELIAWVHHMTGLSREKIKNLRKKH